MGLIRQLAAGLLVFGFVSDIGYCEARNSDPAELTPRYALKAAALASASQYEAADQEIQPDEQLEEQLDQVIALILEGRTGSARGALQNLPQITKAQNNRQLRDIMRYAVTTNDLPFIQWLNDQCPDCAINTVGQWLIRDMGSTVDGRPWSAMNSQTFRYVYEQGGVQHFLDNNLGESIVPVVGAYWIPEADGIYSDYTVRTEDKSREAQRRADRRAMLSFLFANGHDVNDVSRLDQQTALFKAVRARDRDLIDFLLENGANPTVGHNPLATVTASTPPSLLDQLLALGLDPNTVTERLYSAPTTILGRLVESGQFRPELLSILERHGLDVSVIDSDGKTAFDYAGREVGQRETPYTDYLLAKGAVPTDAYYYAALKAALQQRDDAQLGELLSTHPHLANGLEPHERMKPLNRAVASGNPSALALLLASGARLHDENNFSISLLTKALTGGDFDMATLLLKERPDIPVNYQNEVNGEIVRWSLPLMEASAHGNVEWVNRLLECGAVTSSTRLSDYPIHAAALNGHTQVVAALLKAGAEANPVDPNSGKSLLDVLEKYAADDRRIAQIRQQLEAHSAASP